MVHSVLFVFLSAILYGNMGINYNCKLLFYKMILEY